MARLVVLALLADGQLDESELEVLNRRGAFAALGISREDFVRVLYDFCADAARLSEGFGGYRLSPALLAGLFAEVDDPRARERVLGLIVAVVSSDGRFTDGEEKLFRSAMEAWGVGQETGPRGIRPPPPCLAARGVLRLNGDDRKTAWKPSATSGSGQLSPASCW